MQGQACVNHRIAIFTAFFFIGFVAEHQIRPPVTAPQIVGKIVILIMVQIDYLIRFIELV